MLFRRQHQNRANTKSRWLRWGKGETLAFRRSRKRSTWYVTGSLTCSCSPFVTIPTGTVVMYFVYWIIYHLISVPLSVWSAGASADTWQHKRASAGEHHQWLWPGALQESPGSCIWRSGTELLHISQQCHSCIKLLLLLHSSVLPFLNDQ